MPAITFYRHGVTAHMPNRGNPDPPKRGRVVGWSDSAARRNVNFLRSVDEEHLTGEGFAATLTVKDCPPSPQAWSGATRAWFERLRRLDMIRMHWVTEFQRRGVPHLHAALWFAQGTSERVGGRQHAVTAVEAFAFLLRLHWVEVAAIWSPSMKAQHVVPFSDVVGWFQYQAKHCSRSKRHYQRQRESLPAAWSTSGRVWGHRGEWVLQDPATAEVDRRTWFRFRRLVRQSRIAEARASLPLNRRQVSHLRRALKCPDRRQSEVRGVSEWMSEDRQAALLAAAQAGGGAVPPGAV